MQGNGHDRRVELSETIAKMAGMEWAECELSVRDVARQYDIPTAELRRAIGRQRARNEARAAREVQSHRGNGLGEPDPQKILDEAAKPELLVETANLPAAAVAVRDRFAESGAYYEWGIPAKVVPSSEKGGLPQIVPLTVDSVVNEVHRLCRPIKLTPGGQRTECTLPDRVAKQYLAKKGEWQLPRLAGITTAPLLDADGSIRTVEGFDPETRLFCANVPKLEVPERPTESQPRDALRTLRAAFQTFPFADSERVRDGKLELVDVRKNPGLDESSFLAGLMTAVCRPCLYLAPGLMLNAPQRSGSGSGKGLLVQAIFLIAFGLRVAGFTPGDKRELDKRINSDLLEGGPGLSISNVNEAVFASPTLEDAMTERPFKVRLFGVLRNVMLDSAPLIVVNGNGMSPSDDLVRRFAMFVRLDARMENPSLRHFPLRDQHFLADIERRRAELLSAVLTIWRWAGKTRTS
jgi:hypothetical protein